VVLWWRPVIVVEREGERAGRDQELKSEAGELCRVHFGSDTAESELFWEGAFSEVGAPHENVE
jgi:hypothetical protein